MRVHRLSRSYRAAPGWRRGPTVVLAIALVVAALFARTAPPPLTIFDQPFYLGIADDLNRTGRFTDGFMFATPSPDGTRPPGLRFAPLYPALLAAAARLEPGFARATACVVATAGRGPCPNDAVLPRLAQAAALAGTLWLTWWIATTAFGSGTGIAALIVALCVTPRLMRSVEVTMTEIPVLLADTAAIACALAALRARHTGRSSAWAAAAGLLLGLAALLRPSGVELALASGAAGLFALAVARGSRHRLAACLAAFALAFALTLTPWLLRNEAVFGRPVLTEGYAGHTLVQRISFDAMTPHEYAMSFVCWLPDGSGLGAAIAGPGACDRFGWDDHPDSFYAIGLGPLLAETLRKAGGPRHHLHWLLTHEIAAHPWRHALVTLPLAWRGAWIDHGWGLVLMPVCVWCCVRRRRDPAIWLIAGPGWFMLLFNAAVAVNQPRYNLLLVLPYAVCGGLAVTAMGTALRQRRWRGARDSAVTSSPSRREAMTSASTR